MFDHQPGGHGLEHRHLDELSFAGALAMHQRAQGGEGEGEADRLVGDDGRRIAGNLIARRPSHQVGDAEAGLDGVVVGRQLAVGPVGRVAVGADIDDVGLDLADLLVAQPQAFDGLRPEGVHEGIGAFDHLEQGGTRPFVLQIEAERSLVAIDVKVGRTHARSPAWLADVTDRIALGRLDLDDVGALVGQQHRAVGPENDIGEIDDSSPASAPAMLRFFQETGARLPLRRLDVTGGALRGRTGGQRLRDPMQRRRRYPDAAIARSP